MRVADLPVAMRLADSLGREEDDEEIVQQQLTKMLHLQQAPPVGLGSGKSGLRYKAHGLVHSARMINKSWKDACAYVNSTFTWVGDLGEGSINGYRGHCKTLIGTWVDAAVGERLEPVLEFDVQDDDCELGERSDDGQCVCGCVLRR